jgi:hypothetical protein
MRHAFASVALIAIAAFGGTSTAAPALAGGPVTHGPIGCCVE